MGPIETVFRTIKNKVEEKNWVEVTCDYGICDAINRVAFRKNINFSPIHDFFEENVTSWPEYSGLLTYPVPHPTRNPKKAFYIGNNHWDPATEYGAARLRLLDYLIECAKHEGV